MWFRRTTVNTRVRICESGGVAKVWSKDHAHRCRLKLNYRNVEVRVRLRIAPQQRRKHHSPQRARQRLGRYLVSRRAQRPEARERKAHDMKHAINDWEQTEDVVGIYCYCGQPLRRVRYRWRGEKEQACSATCLLIKELRSEMVSAPQNDASMHVTGGTHAK